MQKALPADVDEAVAWMTRLSDRASLLASEAGVKAATDITGFSLMGHAWEMANASGVGMRLVFDRVPVLESAYHYAQLGTFPGGAFDNRAYFQKHVRYSRSITEVQEMLLYDPQTSGGLLLAVPVQALPDLQEKAARVDQPMWEIGEVTDDIFIEIV